MQTPPTFLVVLYVVVKEKVERGNLYIKIGVCFRARP
jgi:hypothetical protein